MATHKDTIEAGLQPGHATRKQSKLFPVFFLAGLLLPVLAGALLAIAYIGFPHAPGPVAPYIMLPLGLVAAAIAQRLSPERCEGGLLEVLQLRLAWAALGYLAVAVKYVLAGGRVLLYSARVLMVISVVLVIWRLLIRYRVKKK